MANLTSILYNHLLNTQSIVCLAKQLSEKLRVTVVYGYCNNLEVLAMNWKGDYDFIEQGKIVVDGANKTLFLYDYYYLHRVLKENHNGKLSNWFREELFLIKEIEESNKCITYKVCENETFNVQMTIYKNSIEVDYLESIDWKSFTRFFSYELSEQSIQYLQEWRKEHYNLICKLGGTEMIVYEDIMENLQDLAKYKATDFKQLKQKARNEHPNNYCHISEFIQEKQYIDLPRYNDSSLTQEDFKKLKNRLPLEPKNKEKYYEIFFDDFREV